MDRSIKEVIIWIAICLAIVTLGAEVLLGMVHDSDNKVRIVQIKEK